MGQQRPVCDSRRELKRSLCNSAVWVPVNSNHNERIATEMDRHLQMGGRGNIFILRIKNSIFFPTLCHYCNNWDFFQGVSFWPISLKEKKVDYSQDTVAYFLTSCWVIVAATSLRVSVTFWSPGFCTFCTS